MKKALTLGLLTLGLFYQQANAQIGKGEKMIGGSVQFSSSKTTYSSIPDSEQSTNSFAITPQLGFGLGNNWIVGLSFGYVSQKQKAEGGFITETKTSVVSPGIFVRKFHQFGDKFGIYGQAEAGYAFGKQTVKQATAPETESTVNGYSIGISPGAFYKVSKRIIIEASVGNIGYMSTTTKPEGTDFKIKNSQFNFSLTNSLSLGFKVIL